MRSLLSKLFFILAAVCLLSPFAHADKLDDLLKGIASDNEAQRVEARQLLPRYGAEAVPRMIGLIADPREPVWRAVFNVLADIENQVCQAGREAERLAVTNEIVKLLAPERTEHEKLQGLRLIPFVLPDDYPVDAIAALLKEEGRVRERARAALEESKTLPSCIALRDALGAADPDFQYGLLSSLAIYAKVDEIAHAADIYVHVTPFAKSESPLVRAAAVRCLAASGNPGYIADLKKIRESSDSDNAFECGDALLRLADAMVLKGGNFDATMDLYTHVLTSEENPVLKGGALAGLGRYGDDRAVAVIVAALQGPQGKDIEAPALNALQMVNGFAESKALFAAYAGLAPEHQLILLGSFGRTGDPHFLDLLNTAAKSEDERFRVCAVNTLAEMQHPSAVEGFLSLLSTLDDDIELKQKALGQLEILAESLGAKGDASTAGKAYLGLYHHAENCTVKEIGLDGVRRFPTPEAYDVLVKTMTEAELAALPDGTLGAIAESLWKADRKAEAQATFDQIMSHIQSTSAVEQAVRLAGVMGQVDKLQNTLGVVHAWNVIGPFKWTMAQAFNEPTPIKPEAIDLAAAYALDGAEMKWKALPTDDILGLVDLSGAFGMLSQSSVFAYAEIEVTEAIKAQVRAGSDDGIKIWINGVSVHENNIDRGTALDQDIAPCELKAGRNSILAQITQGGGGWNFRLRLTKEDGTPIQFNEIPVKP